MAEASVDSDLIKQAILKPAPSVLLFRFISAAKHAPQFERELDEAMIRTLQEMDKLEGKTVLLVDVSGSMTYKLAKKTEVSRFEAASGLAILLSSLCNDLRIFTFSNDVTEVPPCRGVALARAIWHSQRNVGTWLGAAVRQVEAKTSYDRLIVITDEQSADQVPNPTGNGYMINVAPYKNGVGYGPWTHIDGFSEQVIGWLKEYEETIRAQP